jgi:hypothetical protein
MEEFTRKLWAVEVPGFAEAATTHMTYSLLTDYDEV